MIVSSQYPDYKQNYGGNHMNSKTKFLVQSALIAAIYVVLTVTFAPISYGMIQIRVSEALTVLPFFTPAAIPGLFLGCLIANMMPGSLGIIDIVFGSLATLVAAYLSHKVGKKILVPLPPVIVNAVVIGIILYYALMNDPQASAPMLVMMAWVGAGQMIACYGLGYPLMLLLEKYKHRIF